MSVSCSPGADRDALRLMIMTGGFVNRSHRAVSWWLKLGRAPRQMPERPVEQWKAVRPYRSDVDLLDSFTMQREVQPVALDFLGNA
jgi:hypothetical protein